MNDNMSMSSSFSENLKSLMRKRGVTARVVSQATGIPESTLSEWSGGRAPKLGDDVMKLARFFGCSIDFFLTGKESEAQVLEDVINGLDEGFATIHSGVYRVKIEKHTGSSKKKGKS